MRTTRQRVAIYARVSTSSQVPDMQLNALRQLAKQRGWKVVDEYVDLGVSGSKDSRPQLDRLMRDAEKGAVDIVSVWRFDRWARSLRHLVSTLDDFQVRGIDFVSLHDSVDTSTPSGKFIFHVFAALSEFERELIRERVVAGLAAAKARGSVLGRPKSALDREELHALRADGFTMRAIAEKFGVSTATISRALKENREDLQIPSP